jgi:serine/threonine protein kinase
MTLQDFKKQYQWNPKENWIGGGGFGSVYKARDTMDNRRYVAIKISEVKPEFGDYTLQREFDLVKDLPEHQNIARYKKCFRFETDTGVYDFAVLKYYEAGNLEQFLEAQPKLRSEDIYTLVDGLLQGIYYLHQNGIIHRDIKAQNVLIDREDGIWVPKIADFGVSRESDMDISISRGMAISYPYAAPEQLPPNDLNAQTPKIRSNVDLWAIGVMIYRVVAGVNPFLPPNPQMMTRDAVRIELIRRIWKVELPEALETIPEPYQAIIKRCLVKEPSKRVQDAGELLQLLDPERKQIHKPRREEKPKPFSEPKPTVEPIIGLTELSPKRSKWSVKSLLLGVGIVFLFGLAVFGLYQQTDKFSPKVENATVSPPEVTVPIRIVASAPDTNVPKVSPTVTETAVLPVAKPATPIIIASKPSTPVPQPKLATIPTTNVPAKPPVQLVETPTVAPAVLEDDKDNTVYNAKDLKFEGRLELKLHLDCLESGQFLSIKLNVNKLGTVENIELVPNSSNLDADKDKACIDIAKNKARSFHAIATKNGKRVRYTLVLDAHKR